MANIVQFENIGLRYGTGAETLSDVSFTLRSGQFYFVTGASGAGKTSLLKLLYLAQRPSRGIIRLFGEDAVLLPRDRLTPYLMAGGGITQRAAPAQPSSFGTLPHAVVGVGLEYLATNRLGLSLSLDNHYYFSDQLDLLARGSYNDYYWGARLGAVFYLGQLGGPRVKPR